MDSTVSGEGLPCSKCGPRTGIDHSNGQRMLEHMGAHILYDSTISRNLEVCDLCLRPAPMCTIYLKKGHGGSKGDGIDMNRSESTPCTNIPIHCPICRPKQPVVSRYSFDAHFRGQHDLAPADFPIQEQLSASETNGLKVIWKNRFQIPKKRNLKKKALPLVISTAHRVGLESQ